MGWHRWTWGPPRQFIPLMFLSGHWGPPGLSDPGTLHDPELQVPPLWPTNNSSWYLLSICYRLISCRVLS